MTTSGVDHTLCETVDRLLRFIESGERAFHGDSVSRARRAVLEREEVRRQLDALGPRAGDAIAYLCEIVHSRPRTLLAKLFVLVASRVETAGRRFRAVRALGLSERSDMVTDVLILAVTDREPLVRLSAAEALGHLASTTDPVLQALKTALRDGNKRVRFQAAETLATLGSPEGAVPPLAEGLLSPSGERRERAAVALAAMGEAARSAAPLLLEALVREQDANLKAIQRDAYFRIAGVLIGETQHGM